MLLKSLGLAWSLGHNCISFVILRPLAVERISWDSRVLLLFILCLLPLCIFGGSGFTEALLAALVFFNSGVEESLLLGL